MKILSPTLKEDLKVNDFDFYELEDFLNQIKSSLLNYNLEYRKGNSLITDKQFDYIEEVYRIWRPSDEYFDNIGYDVENDKRKQKLPFQMASMDKLHSMIEINKWVKNKGIPNDTWYVISAKLDGNSIAEDLDTKDAWTRGNGIIGRYSKTHINIIESSNSNRNNYHDLIKIDNENNTDIYTYGEVIISNNKFEKYKTLITEQSSDIPSHPRNTVAGFIRSDVAPQELEIADYIRYGIVFKNGVEIEKQQELKICNKINKIPIQYTVLQLKDISEDVLLNLYQQWGKDYEIDGLIIEVNDIATRNKLGRETSNNNPAYARAYKGNFNAVKNVMLLSHTYDMTKQGNLSIVGKIPTTILNGAEITNPTLNNASYVVKYGLYPNTEVGVIRSGGVIPKIISVNNHKIPFEYQFETKKEYEIVRDKLIKIRQAELNIHNKPILTTCPSCNSKLEWDENEVHQVCNNDLCPAQKFYKVVSFFNTLEVSEVGEPTIQLLFDNGYDTIKKILELDRNTLETFDRIGERKAEIIYNNIHSKMKDVVLEKLQHASNLFGRAGSKKLKLINDYISAKPTKIITIINLTTIKGISSKLAINYIDGIDKFNLFLADVNSNHTHITIKENKPKALTSNSCSNINVVFSGIRNKILQQTIIDNGGIIGSGISKKTSHLVMKVIGSGSSKEVKATKLGVNIMTINDFTQYIQSLT